MAADSARVCVDTTVGDQDANHAPVRKFSGIETPERPLTLKTLVRALHAMRAEQDRLISALKAKGIIEEEREIPATVEIVDGSMQGLFQTKMSSVMTVRAIHPTTLSKCITVVWMMSVVAKLETPFFFATKIAWYRLCYDFLITKAAKRRLLPLALTRDARKVYEVVGNNSIGSSVEAFWKNLENRLCNKVHQALLQNKVFDLRWNERHKSFSTYAQKLRSAALALLNGMEDNVLLSWLKAGIPTRLRDQAQLITGSFDEVVSQLSRVSNAQMTSEAVREVYEARVNQMQDRYANYT